MIRPLFLFGGGVMLALGIAGTILPLLPTTPFLLVATWLFSRSSPRIERWLRAHRVLGVPLRDWTEHRAIGMRAKCVALACMGVSYLVAFTTLAANTIMLAALTIVLLGMGTFIATRPSPPVILRANGVAVPSAMPSSDVSNRAL